MSQEASPGNVQDRSIDPIAKVLEVRSTAQDKARVYSEALSELVEVASQLRGTYLVISGVPYAWAGGPIYRDRERFRVTEQKVYVRGANVTDDRRDGAERPTIHISVTLPFERRNSHEPMTFHLHELDMCIIDESPAENYFSGELVMD